MALTSLDTLALEAQINGALQSIYDPEIPVNIYDLGLIYAVNIDPEGVATITMTLTAPNCPAAEAMPLEVANKVKAVAGVTDCKVDIVFEPQWGMEMMSDVAKFKLGLM